MNTLKNKVTLIGHLGMDPEIKQSTNGNAMARFSLATHDSYKNAKGEKVDDTQWHNLVAWGKTAEIAGQFLKKGKEVAVEGKLVHRTWDDKDGNKKYITEVVVSEFQMLGKKD